MLRYYITDGSGDVDALCGHIAALVERRAVDWIQLREKQLPARQLFELTIRVVSLAKPADIRVLVNERADVAIAAGADGVHLPSRSLDPSVVRRLGCQMIGVSCHDAGELADAVAHGASFAVLSPVFAPLSKESAAPPLGLDGFARLIAGAPIPVLALGGITWNNAEACMAAGAAGIAGITLFTRPDRADGE